MSTTNIPRAFDMRWNNDVSHSTLPLVEICVDGVPYPRACAYDMDAGWVEYYEHAQVVPGLTAHKTQKAFGVVTVTALTDERMNG
jgi:hypothetical protein